MSTYHGIGLMSGTSLDGVDIAYCRFAVDDTESWTYQILKAVTRSYPKSWRTRLETLQEENAEVFARTDVEYGRYLGELVQDFISSHNLEPAFVASHGHTIFHQPEKGFTAQIGDGETIAAFLPCPLVTNFRNKDVALKGQGAPLVPFGEKHLFAGTRLFLNLGGFANLTADGQAFDISPCNFALNWAVRRCDADLEFDMDGELGRSGRLLPQLFERLQSLEYYNRPPPKSLGREWFEENFLPLLAGQQNEKPEDILHTLCAHIADQVERAVASTGIRGTPIIITGGGSRNCFLADLIEERLKKLEITFSTQTSTYLIDYKEAMVFAFLGLHVLLGRANTLPSATGATGASPAGSIHLPSKPGRWPLFPG